MGTNKKIKIFEFGFDSLVKYLEEDLGLFLIEGNQTFCQLKNYNFIGEKECILGKTKFIQCSSAKKTNENELVDVDGISYELNIYKLTESDTKLQIDIKLNERIYYVEYEVFQDQQESEFDVHPKCIGVTKCEFTVNLKDFEEDESKNYLKDTLIKTNNYIKSKIKKDLETIFNEIVDKISIKYPYYKPLKIDKNSLKVNITKKIK